MILRVQREVLRSVRPRKDIIPSITGPYRNNDSVTIFLPADGKLLQTADGLSKKGRDDNGPRVKGNSPFLDTNLSKTKSTTRQRRVFIVLCHRSQKSLASVRIKSRFRRRPNRRAGTPLVGTGVTGYP